MRDFRWERWWMISLIAVCWAHSASGQVPNKKSSSESKPPLTQNPLAPPDITSPQPPPPPHPPSRLFSPPHNMPGMDGRGDRGYPGHFSPAPHGSGPFDLKSQDPEMYELESKDQELEKKTRDLSQQLRRAPREEREKMKKELQELVQQHFDAREARRELQLKRLEADLQRMRESMTKRSELRDQIIGRRIAELVGEQSDFDF